MISKGRKAHMKRENNGNSKLNQEQVDEIRKTFQNYAKNGFSQTSLARKFGVSHNQVSAIVNNKVWVS